MLCPFDRRGVAMPARRLLMRKIREVLRLKHEQGLSHQAVAQACAVGVGTVNRYLQRAAQRGLGWPLPDDLDDAALEARLFPRAAPVHDRIRPDCAYIHRELKRDSVTLQLLWEEYAQIHPDGYGRTQFCEIYRQWTRRLRPSMRQVHRAGEKTFIDYSGKRPSLVDRRTGELRRVELFVAVLGASSLTYAAATETQQLPDWIDAHIRMVEYFGGATTLWVPDQLKSAITRPCRYEPGVNRTYEDRIRVRSVGCQLGCQNSGRARRGSRPVSASVSCAVPHPRSVLRVRERVRSPCTPIHMYVIGVHGTRSDTVEGNRAFRCVIGDWGREGARRPWPEAAAPDRFRGVTPIRGSLGAASGFPRNLRRPARPWYVCWARRARVVGANPRANEQISNQDSTEGRRLLTSSISMSKSSDVRFTSFAVRRNSGTRGTSRMYVARSGSVLSARRNSRSGSPPSSVASRFTSSGFGGRSLPRSMRLRYAGGDAQTVGRHRARRTCATR